MYCVFCGEELPNGSVYCSKCGHKVSEDKKETTTNRNKLYIYIGWWTFLMAIIASLIDGDGLKSYLPAIFIYVGVPFFIYTIRYHRANNEGNKENAINSTNPHTETITHSKEVTLREFASRYTKTRICRYIDDDNIVKVKIIFTNDVDSSVAEVKCGFDADSLKTDEFVLNQDILLISNYGSSGYIMSIKAGETLHRSNRVATPPPVNIRRDEGFE